MADRARMTKLISRSLDESLNAEIERQLQQDLAKDGPVRQLREVMIAIHDTFSTRFVYSERHLPFEIRERLQKRLLEECAQRGRSAE